MTSRTFRITVRGAFADLTDEQHAELLARAAEHELQTSRYTREGHLAYDLAARPFFTFRFEDAGDSPEDLADAVVRAETTAKAWLETRGYGYRRLTSTGEDLSLMPLGKRGRRATRNG